MILPVTSAAEEVARKKPEWDLNPDLCNVSTFSHNCLNTIHNFEDHLH